VQLDPYYRFSEERTRSELEIPLMAGGRLIGVLDVQHVDVDGFSPARIQLLEALAGHVGTAIENARLFRKERLEKERMSRELAEARQIQAALSPASPPPLRGFAIDARCIPCREVGGDWYDYVLLPGDRVGVVLADISGKGMAAALLMSSTRSILRLLAEDGSPPGEVLGRLNRVLLKDFPAARFVTMIYAVLDGAQRRVRFANAGHPYPLLVDSGGSRFLETETGCPLGIQDGTFAEREIAMSAGNRLVLYSDGLSEALNTAEEEYGTARLVDRVASAPATLESLLEDVRRFTSGTPASDDLTVMMIQRM
jgi:phosphoserine phosphatase RsbU/P